jgi:CRISPR-associated protein Csx10
MNQNVPSELQSLRIELLSDTTFGRGEGTAGQVDVEVDHDELGIPFVNGKTIRSLLRDTWLTMQSQFPELASAACRVFGPHGELGDTSILRIGRASIDDESRRWIRAAVEERKSVSAATILAGFTDIRSQTSEDRATGAPERTTLRSMRVLIRKLVLTAELRWLEAPAADDVRCLALALLGTRHAGLSRNRGRGHVRFGFHAVAAADSVALTQRAALGQVSNLPHRNSEQQLWDGGDNERQEGCLPAPQPEALPDNASGQLEVWYVPYTLKLNSPAIVTGLAHDPNTVSTLRYIPGSMLRGAVARAIGDPDRDAASRSHFDSLVLGGNVAWLNAYPLHHKSRTLPAPPGFKRDKQQAGEEKNWTVFDLASFDGRPDASHELETEDGDPRWPEESLIALGETFVTFGGTNYRFTPGVSARVHQQRDRTKGRSWTDTSQGHEQPHGTLFACESLDAGQTFEGAIQIRARSDSERDAILRQVQSLLGESVLLGRSRRAEYGGDARVEFDSQQIRQREWAKLSNRAQTIARGDMFRVLLVSPCLVRDADTGQFDPAALQKVIERKFDGRATVRWVRTGFEKVGGLNRKWRLELPQALAVSAGSVVVLEAIADIPTAVITAWENAGLGDRRIEGFGRFVITKHESSGKLTLTKPDPDQSRSELPPSPPELISRLQSRLAAAALEQAIDEIANDIARSTRRRPNSSLIGRLRESFREQSSNDACKQAIGHVSVWFRDPDENKRLKKPAMDQFDRCRLGSESLTRWLFDIIDSPVPRDINLPGIAARCRLIDNTPSDSVDPVLDCLQERPDWLKVRLIDAVLDRMALLNRRQKGDA